jgi:hypothetical protein
MELDFQCKDLINVRSAHASNNKFIKVFSFKKCNEITPVYVSTVIHLYNCYHYFKSSECDKYKIITGYGLLLDIFRAQ